MLYVILYFLCAAATSVFSLWLGRNLVELETRFELFVFFFWPITLPIILWLLSEGWASNLTNPFYKED